MKKLYNHLLFILLVLPFLSIGGGTMESYSRKVTYEEVVQERIKTDQTFLKLASEIKKKIKENEKDSFNTTNKPITDDKLKKFFSEYSKGQR